jgi:hypothetical protein
VILAHAAFAPRSEGNTALRAVLDGKDQLRMGISVSLLFIAAGAILKWAVTATASGVNLATVGVILMVVGAVGLAMSLIFWSSWGGFGGARRGAATTVIRDDGTTVR